MNAIRGHALVLAAVAVFGSAATVRGTGQERDVVRFEGKDEIMMERPFGGLLVPSLTGDDEFDWQSTGNYKGYVARWEVRDGALFLTAFEAKRDGKAVALDEFLPGRKLPTRADWYTGRVRIPIGFPSDFNYKGLYGSVFDRVVVLHVKKGRIVRTEDLKKARIIEPTKEQKFERGRHWLWPFPRLEADSVREMSEPVRGRVAIIVVPPAAFQRTPAWTKDEAGPPISPLMALLLAAAKSRAMVPPAAKYTWALDKASLKKWSEDRYYYEFRFRAGPLGAVPTRNAPFLTLLVLMDGTVPEPFGTTWQPHFGAPAWHGGAIWVPVQGPRGVWRVRADASGQTWQKAVELPDDDLFPWCDVHPVTGVLYTSNYGRSNKVRAYDASGADLVRRPDDDITLGNAPLDLDRVQGGFFTERGRLLLVRCDFNAVFCYSSLNGHCFGAKTLGDFGSNGSEVESVTVRTWKFGSATATVHILELDNDWPSGDDFYLHSYQVPVLSKL
jgi:hypothetical protein